MQEKSVVTENNALVLEEWFRAVDKSIDLRLVTVIFGDVEKTVVEESGLYSPFTVYRVLSLTPKTMPVVVLVRTTNQLLDKMELYAYTSRGWIRVELY